MAEVAVEKTDDEMAGADAGVAVHERAINPGPLDDGGDIGCEIRDGAGPARQFVQGRNQVGGKPGGIDLEPFADAMDVGVRQLEQLMEPVGGLDVGVAAHLAKDRGAFDGFVANGVKLAKQSGPFDFCHK